jgi:acyl carrier protein
LSDIFGGDEVGRMNMARFENDLRAFIAQTARVSEERITESTSFAEVGIDSLSAVEIVCWVEKELQIEIPESAVQRIRTLGDLLTAVEHLKEGFEPTAIIQGGN